MTPDLQAKIAELRRLQVCFQKDEQYDGCYTYFAVELAPLLADALEEAETAIECFEGMKEGVTIRIADLEAELSKSRQTVGRCCEAVEWLSNSNARLRAEVERLLASMRLVLDHDPYSCPGITPSDCLETVKEIARFALRKDVKP